MLCDATKTSFCIFTNLIQLFDYVYSSLVQKTKILYNGLAYIWKKPSLLVHLQFYHIKTKITKYKQLLKKFTTLGL